MVLYIFRVEGTLLLGRQAALGYLEIDNGLTKRLE